MHTEYAASTCAHTASKRPAFRPRWSLAWLPLLLCVTLPAAAQPDIQERTPVPPTRSIKLPAALGELTRITVSADDQRHQPPGFPCAGFYPEHAAYRITNADDETARIGAKSHNDTDLTLSIQQEDGTWICNDDAHENTTDPEVFETLPAGTHTLYIGSFHRFEPLDYTPYIHRDKKPQWARCIDVDVISDPDESTTVIEGEIQEEVFKCDWMLGTVQCDWFLPSKANACVDLSEPTDLQIRTQNASFDTTLVVQRVVDSDDGPVADSVILRNDDISPENRHSQIQAELEPGRYLIFVGSYHRQKDGKFELEIGPIPVETP